MSEIVITHHTIHELRLSLNQSLSEFGLTLKRAIDPKAHKPFSRSYISNLEAGRPGFAITPEIQTAILFIATAQDAERPELSASVQVTVYASPGQIPDGAYIPRTMKWHTCEYPGCNVKFLKTSGSQRYHIPREEHLPQKEKPGHLGMSGPRKK